LSSSFAPKRFKKFASMKVLRLEPRSVSNPDTDLDKAMKELETIRSKRATEVLTDTKLAEMERERAKIEAEKAKAEMEAAKAKAEKERYEKQLAELEGGGTRGPSTGQKESASPVGANLLKALVEAGIDGEKASKFLEKFSPEAIATLNAMNASPEHALLFYALTRESPQSLTAKDVVDIMEKTKSLTGRGGGGANLILDFAKAVETVSSSKGIVDLFDRMAKAQKEVFETRLETEKTKMDKRFDEMMGAINSLKAGMNYDPVKTTVDMLKQMRELAKETGFPLGGSWGPDEMLKWLEWLDKREERREKMQLERDRTEMIIDGVIAPILFQAEPMIRQGARSLGDYLKDRLGFKEPKAEGEASPQSSSVISIKCECGHVMEHEGPLPKEFTCPACGAKYAK